MSGHAVKTVRGTIARNTTYNAAGRVCEAVLGLVLTAYILTHLDTAAWGLWSLVAVVSGYAALFDFGVGSSFARFIAAHAARDQRDAVSAVVTTGLAFYLVFGVAMVVLGVPLVWGAFAAWAPAAGEAAARAENLRFLVAGALVLFAANGCIAPFAAVPVGLQQMGWSNALSVGAALVKFVATAAFLEAGFGVRGLLYAQGVTLGVGALATVVLAFALQPGLRLRRAALARGTFRELFGFGWRNQVARLANLVNFQTDRLLLAVFFGLGGMGMVGVYRLGEELAGKLRQGPALLASALVPAAADLDARDHREQLAGMYLRATKYLAAAAVPLTVFTLGAAELLLHAWLGAQEGVAIAAHVLRLLAVGYCVNLVAGGGMSVALGRGRAELAMGAGLVSLAVNIAATIGLALTIGFWGVPLGTTLGMVASAAWFFHAMRRVAPVPASALWLHGCVWPVCAALPGLAWCALAWWWADGATARGPNLLALGAAAACYAPTYALALRALPFLDAFDVRFLGDTLRLARVPGFRWWTRGVAGA